MSPTEPGLSAAGCTERTASDDMHLLHRSSGGDWGSRVEGDDAVPLLITTLSLHTGKVLLNTDLGDSEASSPALATANSAS